MSKVASFDVILIPGCPPKPIQLGWGGFSCSLYNCFPGSFVKRTVTVPRWTILDSPQIFQLSRCLQKLQLAVPDPYMDGEVWTTCSWRWQWWRWWVMVRYEKHAHEWSAYRYIEEELWQQYLPKQLDLKLEFPFKSRFAEKSQPFQKHFVGDFPLKVWWNHLTSLAFPAKTIPPKGRKVEGKIPKLDFIRTIPIFSGFDFQHPLPLRLHQALLPVQGHPACLHVHHLRHHHHHLHLRLRRWQCQQYLQVLQILLFHLFLANMNFLHLSKLFALSIHFFLAQIKIIFLSIFFIFSSVFYFSFC